MSAEVVTPEIARRGPQPVWVQVALAIGFGIFYVYDLWEVVQSGLVLIVGLGVSFTALGWVILVLTALAPIALFVAAFVLGRRRSVPIALLAYLTGLAVSAAVFLSLSALLQAMPTIA